VVLTDPAQVLGDQAETVLVFWRHLDRMTAEEWAAAGAAAGAAARAAVWVAAGDDARAAAGYDAGYDAWAAARDAATAAAGYATNEIQGARILRERGQPFTFLPMFGFADPEAVLAAENDR
jgi:hypothetical protein